MTKVFSGRVARRAAWTAALAGIAAPVVAQQVAPAPQTTPTPTLQAVPVPPFVPNPPVVLLHSFLPEGWLTVAALELGAVAAEGLLYRYSGLYERPYRFSLIANTLSFSLGFVLNQLI